MNEYIILIFLIFSSFIYGLIGFGDALILIPLITPIIGIQQAIILTSIWGILPTILNYVHYRDHIDRSFIIPVSATSVPGVIIGTILIFTLPLHWIELVLSVFLMIYSTLRIIKIKKETQIMKKTYNNNKNEEISNKTLPNSILFIGGFSYGFFGGLFGASGPITVALLEASNHYKEDFIGNFALIAIFTSFFKLALYIVNDVIPYEWWKILLLGVPIIYISTKIGHNLTPKISIFHFRIIVLFGMLIIGIKMFIQSIFF